MIKNKYFIIDFIEKNLHSELIYMLCRFIPYSIILRAELRGIEWFQFRLYVRPTKGINIGIYLYDIN